MKTETRNIVLWSNPSKRGTEKAYCFFVGSDSSSEMIWIPKSLISHISRDPFLKGDKLQRCTVEVEDWFAEQNDL